MRTYVCGRAAIPVEVRFWSKVNVIDDEDSCWLWTGGQKNGYGRFRINYESIFAHRYSYELSYGKIPESEEFLEVCHTCDVRLCVRPIHLFLATQFVNLADMVSKGRSCIGTKNNHAKLSDELVIQIRKEYKGGNAFQKDLAMKYGVTQVTISAIVRRLNWKHL